jgi:hypothetical protein
MIVLRYDEHLVNQALIRAIEGGNFDVARAMLQDGRYFIFHFKYAELKSRSRPCPEGIPERYWLEDPIWKFLEEKIEPKDRERLGFGWYFQITKWDSLKEECDIYLYPVSAHYRRTQ